MFDVKYVWFLVITLSEPVTGSITGCCQKQRRIFLNITRLTTFYSHLELKKTFLNQLFWAIKMFSESNCFPIKSGLTHKKTFPIRKTIPKAFNKRYKSIPKFIKSDFHKTSMFLILSMRKQRSGSLKHRKFDSWIDTKMTWKQA